MDRITAKNRIKKLRKEISRLRFLYHVKDDPSVTDDIYDSLNRELKTILMKYKEFEDLNAPENRIGGKPLEKFEKVKHKSRMFSMNDAFSQEEVKDWEKRILKILENSNSLKYFCELKLDGLSASLVYEDGIFIRGATRGNGFIGEDVTENLKMINTIPLKLKAPYPKYIEVRGEVVMAKRVWRSLNKKQIKLGLTPFANTRNAAAGSIRQLDSTIVQGRKLDFFAWDIAEINSGNKLAEFKNHSDKHKTLKELGFQVAPYEKKAKNIDQIFSFIKEIEKVREGLPYGTDGMVISVDELELQENLGSVGKAPRYMLAYKYQAERATTKVEDITVNVGRTGVLTPLAHFEPTLVAGSTVSKSTLHNMDQIKRLDIRTGDTVVIQKAGDVIPEVVEVLDKLRDGKEKKFKMPKFCPVCNSIIEKKDLGLKKPPSSQGPRTSSPDTLKRRGQTVAQRTFSNPNISSVAYYCTNKNCSARNQRNLEHFINIFEIYEIGPKIISRLKDEGLISDASDFFTLEVADLSGLERFGDKSAMNIISSINSHKKVLFWRFIYSLGIIHVGEQTAQDLSKNFSSLNNLMNSSEEKIMKIENIGPVVAKSVYNFFNDKKNINLINKFLKNGVKISNEKSTKNKLNGKVFVLTGTLKSISRDEVKKKIIENNGRVSSSVSSKTSYLLAGKDPGGKYANAKKLGVPILSEDEFLKMF